MATASLSASPRNETGKGAARSLRRDGQIPAVIYGRSREPLPLAIAARELDRLLQHIVAESTVIEVALDGRTARTLIREIQRHPFKRNILHVDFQELVAGERVQVNVPLRFVGIPEGVRLSGGILDQIMHEVRIDVDSSAIPTHFDVDISGLMIGHPLHVRDLVLPEGTRVLDDVDLPVVLVSIPRVAAEAPAAEATAEAGAEPEVIRKAKGEGDEGAGESK
jgi:large subunit ribosomal protein L25